MEQTAKEAANAYITENPDRRREKGVIRTPAPVFLTHLCAIQNDSEHIDAPGYILEGFDVENTASGSE